MASGGTTDDPRRAGRPVRDHVPRLADPRGLLFVQPELVPGHHRPDDPERPDGGGADADATDGGEPDPGAGPADPVPGLLRRLDLPADAAVDRRPGEPTDHAVLRVDDVRDAVAAAAGLAAGRAGAGRWRVAVHAYDGGGTGRGPSEADVALVRALGGAGYAGQVLVTEAARDVLAGPPAGDDDGDGGGVGRRLLDLGPWLVDAGDEPQRAFQLDGPDGGGGVAFPPLRSRHRRPGELPPNGLPMLERAAELAAVRGRLTGLDAGSVTTLVGPTGVGKTSLALAAARSLDPVDFPQGVWFVDMATVATGGDFVDRLARVFGRATQANFPWRGGWVGGDDRRDYRREVVDSLHGRFLLVLDGWDRVTPDVADVVRDLLQADRNATVLATGRAPLGLPREHVVPVGPLTAAAGGPPAGTELLAWHAAAGGVALDEASLARLAAPLHGVPLALELAAPLLAVLPPDELAERLAAAAPPSGDERTGGEDVVRRAFLAAASVSVATLSEGAERLFAALSAFAGGWTAVAAATLAPAVGVAPDDVSGLLGELVRRRLVRVDHAPGEGTGRYRMLDAVREDAAGRLARSGRADDVADRHAAFVLDLAGAALAPRHTYLEPDWVRAIEAEFDNVRAAYRHLVARGDVDRALLLVTHLTEDVIMRGRHEVGRWAEELASDEASAGHPLRSTAFGLASNTAFVRAEPERAAALARRSIEVAASGPANWLGHNTLGLLAADRGDAAELLAHMDAVKQVATEAGDRFALVTRRFEIVMMNSLAQPPRDGSRAARSLWEEVGEHDSPTALAMAAIARGVTAIATRPRQAQRHLHDALALARTARNDLLYLQAWRASRQVVLDPADRIAVLGDLVRNAEDFRRHGHANEQSQTIIDVLWHLIELGRLDDAAVVAGYVTTGRLGHTGRFTAAQDTLHAAVVAAGRDGEEARGYATGVALSDDGFAAFLRELVDELATA